MKKLLSNLKPLGRNLDIILSAVLVITGIAGVILFTLKQIEQSSHSDAIQKVGEEEIYAQNTEDSEAQFAYIEGEVLNPGVYEISRGETILKLIEEAGGFTDLVDMIYVKKCLNLAEKVKDEQKIYLPAKDEKLSCQNSTIGDLGGVPITGLVSLNSASLEELETLPGVGPSTAQKIIDARPYAKLEDLLNVKGIGDATFNKLKALISL